MKLWWLAMRPKTLWAAVAPVLFATVLAYDAHEHHWWAAFGCLGLGLLVQIATNLVNDYYDCKKGADTKDRIGPTRVMAAGLVTEEQMRRAIWLVCGAGLVIGGLLAFRGGMPMLVVTVISLICGYLYTGGPAPLGYLGLGDLFVLVFFGPVAVGATYYVQALSLPTYVPLLGLAPGLISTAILAVNNLRDVEGDAKAGKRTLAVRFGQTFARWEYVLCILLASIAPAAVAGRGAYHSSLWLSLFLIPLATPTLFTVMKSSDGPSLNAALANTGKLLMVHTALLSIGWML